MCVATGGEGWKGACGEGIEGAWRGEGCYTFLLPCDTVDLLEA